MSNSTTDVELPQLAALETDFVERRGNNNADQKELFNLLMRMAEPDIRAAVRSACGCSDEVRHAIAMATVKIVRR